jgi:hypothetical protein
MKLRLPAALLCLTLLGGCRAVTFASYSNHVWTQGFPFVSNSPLIEIEVSDPRETIDFGGAHTGNGRWAVIKEIATIANETRDAFQEGKASREKHDAIAMVAQFVLVVTRTLMLFESDQKQLETLASPPPELPAAIPAEARPELQRLLDIARNRAALRSPPAEEEDLLLESLKRNRDLLRQMQQAKEESHGQ